MTASSAGGQNPKHIAWDLSGRHEDDARWVFSVAGPVGPLDYKATANAVAKADNVIAANAGSTRGDKLHFVPGATPRDPVTWTRDNTDKLSSIFPPESPRSTAVCASHIHGDKADTFLRGLHGVATSTFWGRGIAIASDSYAPGQASCGGFTQDPILPFGPAFIPIDGDGLVDFGLTLPGSNVVPLSGFGPGEYFSVTFAQYVDDVFTFDDEVFHGGDPHLIYALNFGADANGVFVRATLGSPPGFPITFTQTASQIESGLRNALLGAVPQDYAVLAGTIDLSGHSMASLGIRDQIDVNILATVPEPATVTLMAVGLAALAAAARRRTCTRSARSA
jgi:hypothetical protein